MIRFLFLVLLIFTSITVAEHINLEQGRFIRAEDCEAAQEVQQPPRDYIIVGEDD